MKKTGMFCGSFLVKAGEKQRKIQLLALVTKFHGKKMAPYIIYLNLLHLE